MASAPLDLGALDKTSHSQVDSFFLSATGLPNASRLILSISRRVFWYSEDSSQISFQSLGPILGVKPAPIASNIYCAKESG